MKRGPRLDADVIGSKPQLDLGPLFTAVGHGNRPASGSAGVTATAAREEPGPAAPHASQAPQTSVAPVDSAPVDASGSGSPGSFDTANTSAHIGAESIRQVRRAHAVSRLPGFPTKRTAIDAERRAFIDRGKAKLGPLLFELAKTRGLKGVTSIDTLALALRHGFATVGEKNQRANSWFASVPSSVGLIAQGLADVYTETGNRPTRYVHPEFARPAAQGVA